MVEELQLRRDIAPTFIHFMRVVFGVAELPPCGLAPRLCVCENAAGRFVTLYNVAKCVSDASPRNLTGAALA